VLAQPNVIGQAVHGFPFFELVRDSARVVATFGTSPYAMPYERDRPIVLCRGMHPLLAQLWPVFKHYGIENLGRSTP
jgi:hypothetical protein